MRATRLLQTAPSNTWCARATVLEIRFSTYLVWGVIGRPLTFRRGGLPRLRCLRGIGRHDFPLIVPYPRAISHFPG